MKDVMSRVDEMKYDEIIDELTGKFDLRTLLDEREKMFLIAVERAEKCVVTTAPPSSPANTDLDVGDSQGNTSKMIITLKEPRDMIKRRSVKLVASDLYELFLYSCNKRGEFPMGVMKANLNTASNAGKQPEQGQGTPTRDITGLSNSQTRRESGGGNYEGDDINDEMNDKIQEAVISGERDLIKDLCSDIDVDKEIDSSSGNHSEGISSSEPPDQNSPARKEDKGCGFHRDEPESLSYPSQPHEAESETSEVTLAQPNSGETSRIQDSHIGDQPNVGMQNDCHNNVNTESLTSQSGPTSNESDNRNESRLADGDKPILHRCSQPCNKESVSIAISTGRVILVHSMATQTESSEWVLSSRSQAGPHRPARCDIHCAEYNQRIGDLERESDVSSRRKTEAERRRSEEMCDLRRQNCTAISEIAALRKRVDDLTINTSRPIVVSRRNNNEVTERVEIDLSTPEDDPRDIVPCEPAAAPARRREPAKQKTQQKITKRGRRARRKSPADKPTTRKTPLTASDFLRSVPTMPKETQEPATPKGKGNSKTRRGKKGDPKAANNDNALKDWLANAGGRNQECDDTTPPQHDEEVVPVSPSWADDSCDDSPSESETTVNDSDESQRADVRDQRKDGNSNAASKVYNAGASAAVNPQAPPQMGKHNGARPKAGTMYNDSMYKDNKQNEKCNNGKESVEEKSYSRVVTKTGWKTMENKKRKRDKISPRPVPPLKGAIVTRNKDVYIQDIDVEGVSDPDDLVEVIRQYCLERAVRPVFIRIIPSRYDSTRAGCKLTVREDDMDAVLTSDFWPNGVRSREWVYRSRDNQ